MAWITWAWMTVCVLLEIRSRLTGRSSARLPASRSLQALAACLVGTTMALSSMGRVAPTSTTSRTRAASASASPAPGTSAARGPGGLGGLRIIEDPPPAGRVVRSGSQATVDPKPLGPPAVVRADGPLNGTAVGVGESPGPLEPSAVPAGRELVSVDAAKRSNGHDPDLVGPKVLRLPLKEHRVAIRDTLWSIASDRLGSPLRWREIAELNYDLRQPDGGALTAEHWIRPGWTLLLPEPSGGEGSVTVDPYWPEAGTEAFKSVDATAGSAGHFGGPGVPMAPKGPIVPLMPVGAGVVGAGVVDLLERMRQVQQRHRSDGSYIRLPGRSDSQFEQRLRLGGGAEIAHAVDCAVHLFLRGGSGPEWGRPTVTGVTVGADTLQLTTDGTVSVDDLANPFGPGSDGSSIAVDRALLPSSASGRHTLGPPPAPLLVTAGQGSDGVIMVNLESLGTLIVDGDPSGSEGVIRALALELATSFWSGWFDLVVVGFGAELERFDRVMALPDLPPLLESLYRRRLHGIESLRTTGFHSFAQARCVDDSDRWDPIVVICGPTVSGEYLAELLELGSDPHLGVAVVAVGEAAGPPDGLRLSGPPQLASLDLLESVVEPQQLAATELDGVTALIDTAGSRQSVLLSEEPYVSISVPMPIRSAPSPADRSDPPTSPSPSPSAGSKSWPVMSRSAGRSTDSGLHPWERRIRRCRDRSWTWSGAHASSEWRNRFRSRG